MMRENVLLKCGKSRRKAFESQSKLLISFILPVPSIMGDNRPIDLHADGEVVRNGVRSQAVGIGAGSNSRPGDIHA
jgi:hypothetical protein